MKVLIITGDKTFKAGHPRYDLQKSAVEQLEVLYWGRGSYWPSVPRGAFDVVTAQDPFWRGLFADFVARQKKAKFNLQVHTDLSAQSFFRRMLAQIVLRHADSVRVVSEKIKNQVRHPQVRVLPVFTDVGKFSSIIRKGHPGKNIVWIGRFEEEKNPIEAIRILKKVSKDVPEARLIMMGKGSLEQKISEYAARLSMSNKIEQRGWMLDIVPVLEIADVVLCTSRHESWGASIIEALAAGLPVVAPDVGTAREAGAFVVSHEKLADKVSEILKSGARGELKLSLLSKEEWKEKWRESLL